nr:hypothetical protein B0A51_12569 [Rachicladosporium sp. CCFEE 5018]
MPSAAAKRKGNVEEPPERQKRGIKIKKATPTPEPPRSATPVMKPKTVESVASTPKIKSRGVKLKDRIHSEEPFPVQAPVIKREIKTEAVEGPIVKLEDVKIKQDSRLEEPVPRVEYTPESKPKQSTRGGTPPVRPPKQVPAPEAATSTREELPPYRLRNAGEIKETKAAIRSALNLDRSALRALCEKLHNKARLTGDNTEEFEAKIALECAQARYEQGRHTGCRFPEFKGFIAPVKGGNHAAHIADKEARMDRQLASMMAVGEEEGPRRLAMKASAHIERLASSQSMTPQAWDASYGKTAGYSTSASYTPQPEQEAVACWELGFDTKSSPANWVWEQSGGWSELVAIPTIKIEVGGKRKLESIEEIEERSSPRAKKTKLV